MAEPLSPEWWVRRLHKRIVDRAPFIELFDRYYAGDHPMPWIAPQAERDFRRLLALTKSNYMGLVIDATVERLQVEGFRLNGASAEPDEDTWRIWQANSLDAESDEGIGAAVRRGVAYTLTAPNPNDAHTPFVWVEDALQAVVEYVPGTNRRVRAAGLKVWLDDWTGRLNATLYLPTALYKFEAPMPPSGSGVINPAHVQWKPREVVGEPWPAPNPLGEVPLVELPNMTREGQSEIADVIPVQDRINKTIADRMMSQDFGAFPQKWATGYPEEDGQGNPVPPIDIGRDRMVTTDVPETRFGQWDVMPLAGLIDAKAEDVNDIAARTRTPPQYLLGRMTNLPGEALKAAESGLVAKVRRRMRVMGESIEETMRLARKAASLPAVGVDQMETVWRNPEFRTEGELVDALVKMRTLEVPLEALWERWGATPQERARWMRMRNAEILTAPDPTI